MTARKRDALTQIGQNKKDERNLRLKFAEIAKNGVSGGASATIDTLTLDTGAGATPALSYVLIPSTEPDIGGQLGIIIGSTVIGTPTLIDEADVSTIEAGSDFGVWYFESADLPDDGYNQVGGHGFGVLARFGGTANDTLVSLGTGGQALNATAWMGPGGAYGAQQSPLLRHTGDTTYRTGFYYDYTSAPSGTLTGFKIDFFCYGII